MSQIQQASVVTNNVNLDIDKNDVLAIAVSRAEAGLIGKVDLLTAQAKETDKLITSKLNEFEAQAKASITADFQTQISNTLDGLKAFGVNATITYVLNRNNKELQIHLARQGWNGRDTIAIKNFKFSELGVDDSEITHLEEQSIDLKQEALATRKKLNNINTLERAVRGKLAEARLREMENGEAVIQAVLADLDLNVKALPSF